MALLKKLQRTLILYPYNLEAINQNSDQPQQVISMPEGRLNHNHCATSENFQKPFCYTTDPDVIFDYCDCDIDPDRDYYDLTSMGKISNYQLSQMSN